MDGGDLAVGRRKRKKNCACIIGSSSGPYFMETAALIALSPASEKREFDAVFRFEKRHAEEKKGIATLCMVVLVIGYLQGIC